MRMILALIFLVASSIPAAAQSRPVVIPIYAKCVPADGWTRKESMVGVFGGIDDEGDIWNVFVSDEGFNILVTHKGLLCLVGSGLESGDHLILPIAIEKVGSKS